MVHRRHQVAKRFPLAIQTNGADWHVKVDLIVVQAPVGSSGMAYMLTSTTIHSQRQAGQYNLC